MKKKWIWSLIAVVLIVGIFSFIFQSKSKEQAVGVYTEYIGAFNGHPSYSRLNIESKVPMKKVIIHWLNNSISPQSKTYNGAFGTHFVQSYQTSNLGSAKYDITVFTNDSAEYFISNKSGSMGTKTIHSANKQ